MSLEEQDHARDAVSLRAELKIWENAFKAAHGRKAGREDIKKDIAISAKYKLYHEWTRPPKQPALATTPRKSTRPAPSKHSPVRPASKEPSATPRKTPMRSRRTALQSTTVLSPVQEAEPEPTPQWIRAALGPTPQRDGHVLGLFDDRDDDVQETPLKAGAERAQGGIVVGTPSKGDTSAEHIHMKSPDSSHGKRFMLAKFAGTPLKRKWDSQDFGTTSSSRRRFATPSFLRRHNPLAKVDEEDSAQESVHRPPFQKRGLVRSLSTIIQNLKKQQDNEMDDEWDIMGELEAEERGETVQKRKKTPEIQVEDSQAVEMPLGPDQGFESSDESSATENGLPTRKPWKKKGLKRQTKRTNMRPVLHKARKEGDEEPDQSADEQEKVAETQLQNGPGEDEKDECNDTEEDPDPEKPGKKSKSTKGKDKEPSKDESKKKPRKINAETHANYRRLNIKNKNSKAKGRGKFGKR